MRILLLPLLLAGLALTLAPTPPADDVPALIERLATLSRSVDSSVAWIPTHRPYFAALDPADESLHVRMRQRGILPSDVLRDIVQRGAAAVPHLIAHLDDRRATCFQVWSRYDLGGHSHPKFNEVIDVKYGPPPPHEFDLPYERRESPYTVTVGDLCFVALGQIVNRNYLALRGPEFTINTLAYPVVVTSPTQSPAVLAAVRAEWGTLTPERHRASLVDDFRHPDTLHRGLGACRRIAYYYPDALESLVLPILQPEIVNEYTAALIAEGLLHAPSARIDREVRELLVTTTDDKLAHACMQRLLGRGYDADIERIALQHDREEFWEIRTCLGWTRAHVAVARQDIETLQRLGDLATRDRLGRTPVELAAELGHTDIVRLLVARGCAVSNPLVAASAGTTAQMRAHLAADPVAIATRDARGATPLYLALQRDDADVVLLLLDHGANPDAPGQEDVPPLHLALARGEMQLARLLLERGGSPDAVSAQDWTGLHNAVSARQTECVRLLLTYKARPDVRLRDSEDTPLHLAADAGEPEIARLLLAAGATIAATNKDQETPLLRAVHQGHTAVVRLLLAHGASTAPAKHPAYSPLHRAAARGRLEVLELLLAHGADVNGADPEDPVTPLHEAISAGQGAAARFLLARGAKVDAQCSGGDTPLHWAVLNDRADLVELLLDHGAQVNLANKYGEVALLMTVQRNELPAIARLLLDRKANPDGATNARDGTPLLVASREGRPEFVRLLVTRGATANCADEDGRTPLRYAIQANDLTSARLLLEHGADPRRVAWRIEDGEPLHLAAALPDGAAMVALLLEHGADIHARECYLGRFEPTGPTALEIATECGHTATVALLKSRGAR